MKKLLRIIGYFFALILIWLCLCAAVSQINQCTHNFEQKRCILLNPK